MKNELPNNLFSYASSELTQDAFISWLCSFALEHSQKNESLSKCAKELIVLFVPELISDDFILKKIEQQVYYIDILLTIEANDKVYKIIIEDKTYTSEHDNQLKNYIDAINKEYPDCIVRGVYYKTGFQCSLSAVNESGYEIITREKMLSFMRPYIEDKTIDNQIFLDYYEYWNTFQIQADKYRKVPVSKWCWKSINGFYESLKNTGFLSQLDLWMGYSYVANPNGGFHGLWTGSYNNKLMINDDLFEFYLQLEMFPGFDSNKSTAAQLCLKMSIENKTDNISMIRNARNAVIYDKNWHYKLDKYNFVKPKRLSVGRTMTIGIYRQDDLSNKTYEELKAIIKEAVKDYFSMLSSFNCKNHNT